MHRLHLCLDSVVSRKEVSAIAKSGKGSSTIWTGTRTFMINTQCVKTFTINTQCVKTFTINTQYVQTFTINTQYVKTLTINTQYVQTFTINTQRVKTLKTPKGNWRCHKSVLSILTNEALQQGVSKQTQTHIYYTNMLGMLLLLVVKSPGKKSPSPGVYTSVVASFYTSLVATKPLVMLSICHTWFSAHSCFPYVTCFAELSDDEFKTHNLKNPCTEFICFGLLLLLFFSIIKWFHQYHNWNFAKIWKLWENNIPARSNTHTHIHTHRHTHIITKSKRRP